MLRGVLPGANAADFLQYVVSALTAHAARFPPAADGAPTHRVPGVTERILRVVESFT